MLEMKTNVTEVKNALDGLISRLDPAKQESGNLKIRP